MATAELGNFAEIVFSFQFLHILAIRNLIPVARRVAPAVFYEGDYCVIPLGGSLHQKFNPARRFAPAVFNMRDYCVIPLGGILASEI